MRTLPALAALTLAATAIAQPTLVRLDTIFQMPPDVQFGVLAISNDAGTMIGNGANSEGMLAAYRWTPAGGVQSLDSATITNVQAYAMSADGGTVVGRGDSVNGVHALQWTPGLGGRLTTGFATFSAISADGGMMTGTAYVNHTPFATRWSDLNTSEVIGPAGSQALAASADGSVVAGVVAYPGNEFTSHLFRWTASTGYTDLGGGLPGYTQPWVSVSGISGDGGTIIGLANTATTNEAFRWTAGGGMESLGRLSAAQLSIPTAVNFDGSMILGYTDGQDGRAFCWTPGTGMLELGDYLASIGCTGLDGWQLTSANTFSPDGRLIIGAGYAPDGHIAQFLVTLPAPISAAPLVALALIRRRPNRR